MTLRLPYVTPQMMRPRTREVPLVPFVLSPGNYMVIGGNLVRALALPDGDGKRQEGFTVRARYETPFGSRNAHDATAEAFGVETGYNAGRAASEFLRRICKGRALFIVPATSADKNSIMKDRQGKLIADFYVSGEPGPLMDMGNAISAHHLMIQNRYVHDELGVLVTEDPLQAIRDFPYGTRSIEIHQGGGFDSPGFS